MLEKAIKAGVNAALIDTMVSMPAIIQSFDAKAQTVKAQIAIQRIIDGKNVPYTVSINIPIILPSVQGFHITMPIKKGDECLLVFADRCIDNWFELGGMQPQLEHRIHHISDGFAIIGGNSTPNLIGSYDTESMVIRNTNNNQKITLKSSGDIEIDTTANVNVNCENATVTAKSTVKIDTPVTTVTGALQVDGPITAKSTVAVTGAVTSAASVTAPLVTGSTNVIMGGISGTAHVHGGVASGIETTDGPQ